MPPDYESLEEIHKERENPSCQSKIVAIVDSHQTMVNAIFDTAELVSQIKSDIFSFSCLNKQKYVERDNLMKQIKFNAGCLWVLSGMCLLEISTSVSPVDPLQTSLVQLECYKAEVYNLFT